MRNQGNIYNMGNCCNTKVKTVEKEVRDFSYCIKIEVTKQKFHQRKKASDRDHLCATALLLCFAEMLA